ncbi:MAG: hypothetical protein QW051_02830 [Candidatus Aenigmatarchaeota archaeon]
MKKSERSEFIYNIEKNLGKLPPTVHSAFKGIRCKETNFLEASKKVYLESILDSLKKRPKNKMHRYKILARLVFSYINFLYELLESATLKDKINFVTNKENFIIKNIDDLFFSSIEILIENKPRNVIKFSHRSEDEILKYYDIIFEIVLSKYDKIRKLEFTKHHFKEKIKSGAHPLFSKYVINAYKMAFKKTDKISPLIVTLESVIHGIDDYVDMENQNYEKFYSDLANIIIGLFGILFFILNYQQKNHFDNFLSLFKRKTKMERILHAFKESIIKLTWTPFVERDVIKILKAKTDQEEYQLAMKNLETRTKGTTATLTEPIKILLNLNSKDAENFAQLVWILRAEQMLFKDLLDIEVDKKNKDYKAPCVWFMKYKKTEKFKEKVKYLSEFYYKKGLEIKIKLEKKYPEATLFLFKEITKIKDNINQILEV